MSDRRPFEDFDQDDELEEDDRLTRNLAGLAFTLALVVLGLTLVQRLGQTAKLEDCLMSGRTNCAPVDTSTLSQ
ncbi:MAG TPA: hypothetical protein VKS60_10105 [Stellaceae bacterium]|nr:hypothetical protein [Stellaceae bacterium]